MEHSIANKIAALGGTSDDKFDKEMRSLSDYNKDWDAKVTAYPCFNERHVAQKVLNYCCRSVCT